MITLVPIVLSALAAAFPGHRIVPQCVTVTPGNRMGWYQWDNGPRYVPVAKEDCQAATAFTWAPVPSNVYGIDGLLKVAVAYADARSDSANWNVLYRIALARLPRILRPFVKSTDQVRLIVQRAREISDGTFDEPTWPLTSS